MKPSILPLPSSYRDHDGFVFMQEDKIYRQINECYFPHYDLLLNSGLYESLVTANRLVSHTEVNQLDFTNSECKIILPEQIPFITHPYEWSFSMWKDAAIVTLKIAKQALEHGMYLKDATPYNIQFTKGRPVFIDTLSFEKYEEGKPWVAYNQFCESFLAPLLLQHYCHRDIGNMFLAFPNGISKEILKSLLPFNSRFKLQVYLHVFLQSKIRHGKEQKEKGFTKAKFILLLNSLTSLVSGLRLRKNKSVWNNYYSETILSSQYLEAKKRLVTSFLSNKSYSTIIDLGTNDGVFSLLLKDNANRIIAVDADVNCIEELYNYTRKKKIKNIVPLFSSLNAPTPAVGWNNEERTSLLKRLNGELVLALALVHHLAIANNVPLTLIAKWLHQMGEILLIEFVPKSDEKVKQLLKNREDIFDDYNLVSFKSIFENYYLILNEEKVGDTDRVLFLMKRK